MQKPTLRTIPFGDIHWDYSRNPRVDYDIEPLSADIEENGLMEPVTVSERADGSIWGLRGHRRSKAIALIIKRGGKGFDSILCSVHKGLTMAEEIDLIMDHGSQKPLDREDEVYRTVASLFRNDFTELHIAVKCDALFARAKGKTPKSRPAALALDDPAKRAQALKNCWRGRLQKYHAVVVMPDCVEEAYLAQCAGEPLEGTPNLTVDRIKDLYSAFLVDKDANSQIDPISGGPEFKALWKKFRKADKTGGNDDPKPKRKSAKEIDADKSKYLSHAVRAALGSTIGEEVIGLDKADRNAFIAEFIAERDPDLWGEVEARYLEIRKEMREAELDDDETTDDDE